MATTENNRFHYMAPLDGIRAIAILGVVIFHVAPAALTGGFTGVDVFFVLSGFLITSIILHDLREGVFSLREFYLRRIQRLFPNAVLAVSGAVALWLCTRPPSLARQTADHALWTLCNLSNFYILSHLGGYWDTATEWAPLTHTWSLAVEEQFYLIFPGTILLISRHVPRRLKSILIAGTAISFALCLVGTYTCPLHTFYLLPTRVWELLLGSILAAFHIRRTIHAATPPKTLAAESLGWAGLGLIALGYAFIFDENGFPGWVSLLPTVGTAFLIVSILRAESRISRMLSRPVMVLIGRLSYSIYLWHWPLITLGKIQAGHFMLPRSVGALAGCGVGIMLATLAYYFVEQPLRRRDAGRHWRLASIASCFALAVCAATYLKLRPLEADPQDRFDPVIYQGKLFDAGRDADRNLSATVRFFDVVAPPLPAEPGDAWQSGGIIHLHGGGRPKVVVLGSSHALMYSRLIDDLCREMSLSVAFLAVDGATPVYAVPMVKAHNIAGFPTPAMAAEFDEARKKWIREWHPEIIFVIDRWDVVATAGAQFDVKLKNFIGELAPFTSQIIFVAQVPVVDGAPELNLRELVSRRMGEGTDLPLLQCDGREPRRQYAVNVAENLAAELPMLRVIRADRPFYQPDGSIRYASGRSFYYADDDHLSDAGSEVVRGLFEKALREGHAGAIGQE